MITKGVSVQRRRAKQKSTGKKGKVTERTTVRLPAELLKDLQHAVIDIDSALDQLNAIKERLSFRLARAELGSQARAVEAWRRLDPADQALVAAMPRYLAEARSADVVRTIIRQWIESDP